MLIKAFSLLSKVRFSALSARSVLPLPSLSQLKFASVRTVSPMILANGNEASLARLMCVLT